MRTNYHTHTKRCKHAYGEDEEYVKSAIKGGYSILGFADHTPWPFNDGYVSPMRMEQNQLSSYVESINSLKSLYSNQIELKVGLECEYCKDYINWLFEIKEQYNLDYLLFGNHFPNGERSAFYTAQDQKLYLETSIQAMRTGLFECMAHPEALFKDPNLNESTKDIFRELVRAAKEFDVIMELNTSLKFRQELWEIISTEDCKVVIGLDAHKPDVLEDDLIYTQALANLKYVNIVPITDITQKI